MTLTYVSGRPNIKKMADVRFPKSLLTRSMSIEAKNKPPSSGWFILSAFSATLDDCGIHPRFPYLDRTRGQFSSCVRGQAVTPIRQGKAASEREGFGFAIP